MQQVLSSPHDPLWLSLMIAELGVRETPGEAATPRIKFYHSFTTLPAKLAASDETAWCSSCMNYVISTAGFKPTRSAAARSWERWGHALPRPARGAIVVLSRGPNPAFGHVGLLLDWTATSLTLIGGNQENPGSVSIKAYPRSRLVTMRWPHGVPLPYAA